MTCKYAYIKLIKTELDPDINTLFVMLGPMLIIEYWFVSFLFKVTFYVSSINFILFSIKLNWSMFTFNLTKYKISQFSSKIIQKFRTLLIQSAPFCIVYFF